jgi:hypothetical protein
MSFISPGGVDFAVSENARSAANTTFFGPYRRTCSSVHPINCSLMPEARTYYVWRGDSDRFMREVVGRER